MKSSLFPKVLFGAIFCLNIAPACADALQTILADEFVFSELECLEKAGGDKALFSIEKSRLTFPLVIREKGENGWVKVEVNDQACWIAPQALALRGEDIPAAPVGLITRGLKKKNYAVVKVHFGTNRKATGNADPEKRFEGGRGKLTYGTSEVSIPRDHRLGQLEQAAFWRFEFNPDPNKHVVLMNVSPQSQADFLASVRDRVEKSKSRSLFVFVHGYNVNFADAARRTAQMTYDLGYDGAPIFFSWPSQAKLSSYMEDENNSEWSIPDLQSFLTDVAQQARDGEIYLVAHSMGNRVATLALTRLLRERPELRGRFKEVLLIAPDIDADVFKRDIAPFLLKGNTRVTLYASNNDKALQASKKLHGSPRLGEATPVTLQMGMDSIDATEVETDLLGHSYFAETRNVLSDIFSVIRERRPFSLRPWLTEVLTQSGKYWKFQKP